MADPKSTLLKGGLGAIKRLLSSDEQLTAAQRAEAGRRGAELIKSQQQVNPSEALGQLMEKGFTKTATTQADRTRVGGGNIGGAPFSAISEADPAYAGKVWGVMDEGTAKRLTNLTTPETAWTTMLGSANQLKTNPIVFDKLKRGFQASMKEGNLSPALEAKINHNLALTFGEGASIRDPGIWKQADTFEKRAALADLMMGQGIAPSKGGLALGGEKSGKGVIFKPTDILKRETEPSLMHTEHEGNVPTFAAGPRLFKLEKETEYRPDLHPGFPTLIGGKDLGYNVKPAPTEVYLPDWHAKFKKDNPERKAPGYYDLALGVKGEGLPSQKLNDEYIRHLLREGFKDGGEVNMDEADARLKAAIGKHMAKGGSVDLEAADARLSDAVSRHMAGGGGAFKQIQFKAEGGVAHMAPGGLLKGAAKIGKRLFGGADELTPATKGGTRRFGEEMGGTNIVKEPGGNWLTGSAEKSLAPLKKYESPTAEDKAWMAGHKANWEKHPPTQARERALRAIENDIAVNNRNEALNKWVDSNLSNYVKKQMGTADDPVRALAEQGVIHAPSQEIGINRYRAPQKRVELGQPQMGQSEAAKAWEDASDAAIDVRDTDKLHKMFQEPWMEKAPAGTKVANANDLSGLGFDHIMDVLREDLTAGRIRPEQLNKVSMEQAVRRTYEYDQELAAKINATRAAQREGLPVHKEYPEGYKWIELNKPGAFASESEAMGHSVRGYEPPKGHADWTEGSGEQGSLGYGHGGWEAIKSGRAKVYSLVNPKGEPHVTIESRAPDVRTNYDEMRAIENQVSQEADAQGFTNFSDRDKFAESRTQELKRQLMAQKQPEGDYSITQIKGKQNRAPNEEYLPFVQDFVKSGKWSDVGDIHNTGLRRTSDAFNETERAFLKSKGVDLKPYIEPEETARYQELFKQAQPAEDFAEGGGAFKTLQWAKGYDKGGITTSGGDFSAEDIDPSVSYIPGYMKRDTAELWGKGKEQLEKEYKQLGRKGGKKDLAIRVGSQLLGGVPDIINFGLEGVDVAQSYIPGLNRPGSVLDTEGKGERVPKFKLASENPWLGSQRFIDKFKEAKLLGENEFPMMELASNLIVPSAAVAALKKGKQAYKGAKALAEVPNKRRGGLAAMAR